MGVENDEEFFVKPAEGSGHDAIEDQGGPRTRDGNAAIWGAVRQVWPEAGEQRCWNHKMRNVLDQLPQREQSEAKDLLRAVVRQALQAVVSEGGGRTRGRLGADGGVLRLPRGPLEASTHDEW